MGLAQSLIKPFVTCFLYLSRKMSCFSMLACFLLVYSNLFSFASCFDACMHNQLPQFSLVVLVTFTWCLVEYKC
uniref:Uncharacterized protein n=1 Tax=Arundo donax TaxID=35708 RepID=A0A0A9C4A9_ARUDO